ncbi:receptor-type tyrosine-protein phosphatase eta isoform X1 [Lucilia sericata]|uniref:receptor-type tyrosine-protein phosphatase eta isoform X1 n=1 Tax=Lucilia sericata TaxID=13632 RepID=UPI0018A81C59|nr:receptor-type tyrosine-protein phosphatase eta isoform X1 [Lucilia sericata]
MANKIYFKKHWKPPYQILECILIFILLIFNANGQNTSSENTTDDIEIQVEKTSNSLAFTVVDTEKYELQNVTCRSIKNVETAGNENHICLGLDPCSTYLAVLTIKQLTDENQQMVEITRDEKTEYQEPVVLIDEILTSTESINITWTTEYRTCVLNYQVEAVTAGNTFQSTLANDINFQLFESLSPCREYTITLKTYNINSTLISTQTNKSTTEYEEPGNVTLSIVPYENAQMKVTWGPLTHTTCVRYYYLKWFIKDCDATDANTSHTFTLLDDSVEDGNSTTTIPDESIQCEWNANLTEAATNDYVIGGLEGCEDYIFQIYINNNVTIKSEQAFVSPEQVPSAVSIISTDIGNSNISLIWNPPVHHRKCVKDYFVEIKGPQQRPILEPPPKNTYTEDTYTDFDDLDPCGKYNYTITPRSRNESLGQSFSRTFETLEGRPSAVQYVTIVSKPLSFQISWEPPAYADLCLNVYRLCGWDNENKMIPEFDQSTPNTSIFIDGLKSCMTYTIQIIPTTKSMDGELLHIEEETASMVAPAPEVQMMGVYPTKFAISARESDVNNKCATIFARIVCIARGPAPIAVAEKYVKGQLVILFNAEIGPLSPFTEYVCNTSFFNIAGWSANKTFVQKTESYFPNRPEHLSLKTRTNSTLSFTWTPPLYANGIISLYILYFQFVEAGYGIPSRCSAYSSDPVSRESSVLELLFNDLRPYTRYSIQVAAKNEFGIGEYTPPNVVITKPWISDPITNLKSTPNGPSETDSEYKAYVILSWFSPCKSNGLIEYFLLEFTGSRQDYDTVHFQREFQAEFNSDGVVIFNETNLRPEYSYSVSVSVKTKDVDIFSTAVRDKFESPAGIPNKLEVADINKSRVEAYENSNPSKTAIVRFPADILESDSGTIMYVALLLSQKDCDKIQLRYGAMNTILEWPTTKSWNNVYEDKNSDCITQYQTTPAHWNPRSRRAATSNEIEFVIGTEDCVGSSSAYCNGPLKPDTEYSLVIRLFTKSGYNDAAILEFRTDALIELTIILASVSSCLLLAFIAGFIYLWVTKRIKWQRESCHGIEDSFGDIIAKNFAIFYRDLSKPEKIAREFKELTAVALDLSYSASEMGYNKNRYADIFPYDKNRVILDIDADGSDYINASFIDGYRRRKEYIATQGPKPESTKDFWRMVLQHNVRVIVMVTQFREGDIIKCHEYFPLKSKGINVIVKKKDSFDLYDRTELSVTHETFGLKQKVVHFYFKKWPDHGCPTDPTHLITFIRKVKVEKIPSYSPIVVHCSAGVGRTGTFIGLDIIMQRLKNESKINIYETVKKLRFQRMKMVQTLAQYTFLYTCAYELVKHKNTRSILKEDSKTQKKVSFESDPESNSSGTRKISDISRNESDMSSILSDNPSALERSNRNTSGTTIPIRFSSIIKEPNNNPDNNENDESFM